MSEPLKPRIDFDGPLEAEKMEALKSARAFDGAEAAKFAPARVDALEEDEGGGRSGSRIGSAAETEFMATHGQRRSGYFWRQRRGAGRTVDNDRLAKPRTGLRWAAVRRER
ncbi:Uncharacterised protein [Raoultella planticola]|uniref:Uncharacterized protein n=1 Tax=Raoultella planticola TaxID=575 RepID=A0A485AL97_RAOPL|nr:Uncharacterised protein [Raoultella planticola]